MSPAKQIFIPSGWEPCGKQKLLAHMDQVKEWKGHSGNLFSKFLTTDVKVLTVFESFKNDFTVQTIPLPNGIVLQIEPL